MSFNQRWFFTFSALSLALAAHAPAQAKTPRRTRAAADYAYVFNSGTGGLAGYRIYVDRNGHLSSATLYQNGRTSGGRRGTLTPTVTRRFFADLAVAEPVDALPMMSYRALAEPNAAPGIRVTIRYHGRQSSDLRRAGSGAGATLYQDIKQIVQVLRLPIPDKP